MASFTGTTTSDSTKAWIPNTISKLPEDAFWSRLPVEARLRGVAFKLFDEVVGMRVLC